MRKLFFAKLALFILPFTLYFVPTVGTGLYAGEFTPLRQVVEMQATQSRVLYGPAYWEDQYTYKLLSVKLRHPKVVTIGSSRIMQFRSLFFNKQPAAFFNAGGAVRSLEELQNFIDTLENDEFPSIMIIGLDQHWVNPTASWQSWATDAWLDANVGGFTLSRALSTSWSIYNDYQRDRIQLDAIFRREDPVSGAIGVGINALIAGNGFRNDGSHQEGSQFVQATTSQINLQQAQAANVHFSGAKVVDEAKMIEMEHILQQLAAHDVFVIGFSPPFVGRIYDEMQADGNYLYLAEQAARFEALFGRYGFAYFDFTDGEPLGATDQTMLDIYHSSEYIALKTYYEILQALPTRLEAYSDLQFIEAAIQDSTTPLLVFDRWF